MDRSYSSNTTRRQWENDRERKEASAPARSETDSKPKKGRVVKQPLVNVRNRPTMSGSVLKVVKKGSEFEILGHAGVFTRIKMDPFEEAYIMSEFFEEI